MCTYVNIHQTIHLRFDVYILYYVYVMPQFLKANKTVIKAQIHKTTFLRIN